MIFDVNLTPGRTIPFIGKNMQISIPNKIAKTGAPIMGKRLPRYVEGSEIKRHNRMPRVLFFKKFIVLIECKNFNC